MSLARPEQLREPFGLLKSEGLLERIVAEDSLLDQNLANALLVAA